MSTVWKAAIKDVVAAMRKQLSVEPSVWECLCGCGNALVYARTTTPKQALWVMSTVTPDPGPLRMIGLENASDFNKFLTRSKAYGEGRVPCEHWERLITALTPLVPGGWT